MASSEHSLAYIERHSVLNRIYPLVKLASLFVVAVAMFLYRNPRSGAIMFATVLLVAVILGRIPLKQIFSSARYIFMLAFLLMFFHMVTEPGQVVFSIGPFNITDNGITQGFVFFFRLSVVVMASFLLIWTTETRDLMVSLAKAGMPYRMAFTVFLALRFLPLVQREVDAVRDAHSIRGRASRSGPLHRFKLWQRYIFTVLVNGLRKAEITATSLDTRAFGYYPTRSYLKDVYFHYLDLILLIATILITTGLLMWERML